MSRFMVYSSRDNGGLLLDVQTDLLDGLNTRIVVPLIDVQKMGVPAKRLNPVFELSGRKLVMATQFMASVPAVILGDQVADLSTHHDEITQALDMVFFGF